MVRLRRCPYFHRNPNCSDAPCRRLEIQVPPPPWSSLPHPGGLRQTEPHLYPVEKRRMLSYQFREKSGGYRQSGDRGCKSDNGSREFDLTLGINTCCHFKLQILSGHLLEERQSFRRQNFRTRSNIAPNRRCRCDLLHGWRERFNH